MATTETTESKKTTELDTAVALLRLELDKALKERDLARGDVERLRAAMFRLQEELELIKRRMFVAKAERVDISQLEMEFMRKSTELASLHAQQAGGAGSDDDGQGEDSDPTTSTSAKPKSKPKPKGRRRVEDLTGLPVEVLTLEDDATAPEGSRLIGYEESWKLAWRAGTFVRLQIKRPSYEVIGSTGPSAVTTPMPRELMPRVLAAPSLLAHIAVDKFCDGLPFYRQAERFQRLGLDLDRSVMSRWLEDLGASLGATIVEAMRKDALATAFCLATDATGVGVQPPREVERGARKVRKPCKRGHVFVVVADRDHIFFVYTQKETSAAVQAMFHGFSGYVQADAKSVFDVLFVPPDKQKSLVEELAADGKTRYEVACWSHARRKFWESAAAKNAIAREALYRIHRFYAMEATWRDKPPATIKALRDKHLRPEMEDFFAWAEVEYDKVKDEKGSLRSALGYALRQREPLMRPLDDGRLPLDNNRSERALRKIAVGRKNWLFFGSDEHAEAGMNIMSVLASARLHGIEPEQYLREIIRVLPYWPRDNYLALTPKHWKTTRERIGAAQLAAELGRIDVPQDTREEEVTN